MTVTPVVWTVDPVHPDPGTIEAAARIVCEGGLVIVPTETVYGLAADAANPAALERLNRVKGRPPQKPYALQVTDATAARALAPDVPPAAARLMERFWPGPLTIVLPTSEGTVGIRVPEHPVARALLRRCGRPLAVPSANRSGAPAPMNAQDAMASLKGQYDGVLDAGPSTVGRESTVVSVNGEAVAILREGAIPTFAVRAAAGGATKA
mgnify:CR=1 FL=1